MPTLKYLFKNITLLNVILFLSILLSVNFIVFPLLNINLQYSLPSIKKPEQNNVQASPQPEPPMAADYMLIAEQNLFHPERKIPEKKEEKQLPKPEFILYGTLIADGTNIAYMEDVKAPYNTGGRGKRQKVVSKGTSFSGFILTEVYHDRVVMVRGEEKIEVKITDQQYKKARGTETTATTPIADVKAAPAQEKKDVAAQPQSAQSGRVEVKTTAPTRRKTEQGVIRGGIR